MKGKLPIALTLLAILAGRAEAYPATATCNYIYHATNYASVADAVVAMNATMAPSPQR